MIRIALVEDDRSYREELIAYLHQYEEEKGRRFAITEFGDGDEIAENYHPEYDIILMDIEMKFMDGMTAAGKIRELDSDVIIIFITNMPQYAIRGYTVGALDYVLKPVAYFPFSRSIDRAVEGLKKHAVHTITIAIRGGMKKLDVSKITYIEVIDHDLVYHTEKESFVSKGVLSDAEEDLKDLNFIRCSKSYLVNLEYIEAFQGSDIQVNGTWIQVSRTKRKVVLDALNNYMNGSH